MPGKRGGKKSSRRTSLPDDRNISDNRTLDSKLWFSTLNSLLRHMLEIHEDESRYERDDGYADSRLGSPIYFGYSISLGESGVPLVREFGNRRPDNKKYGDESTDYSIQEPREKQRQKASPAFETILDKKRRELRVIVDLPGFSKQEDIRILPRGKSLRISAKDELHSYNFSVPLRKSLHNNPMSVEKTSYNNGILEVTLKLLC